MADGLRECSKPCYPPREPVTSSSLGAPSASSFLRGKNVNFSSAKAAGGTDAKVLHCESQFLLAVRAFGIDIGLDHGRVGRIEAEVGRAEFTLDPLTQILSVDLQFLIALRTTHEHAGWFDFNHGVNLLKWDESRNLNAVMLQLWIQQRATFTTMDHSRRHVFAAIWAESTGPSGHILFSNSSSIQFGLNQQVKLTEENPFGASRRIRRKPTARFNPSLKNRDDPTSIAVGRPEHSPETVANLLGHCSATRPTLEGNQQMGAEKVET